MGATEDKTGTMSDTAGQAKVTLTEKGKNPGDAKVSPEDTPKISQKAFDDAVHAAKSETGRAVKKLEAREAAVKVEEERIAEARKQSDAKELEAAKDDPELQSVIQRKQAVKAREIAADAKEKENTRKAAEHEAELEESRATRMEFGLKAIADEFKVDIEKLQKDGEAHVIVDLKQYRVLAKSISVAEPFTPYSGGTIGGSDLSGLTPQARAKAKVTKALEKMK